MAASSAALNQLKMHATRAAADVHVGTDALVRIERHLREDDIQRALALAKEAAAHANALVAALSTSATLVSLMDLSDEAVLDDVRGVFAFALDN